MPTSRHPVGLSVIMPVLNEEESLENAIERVVAALESLVEDFEVIVVNDGSRDGTGEIADRFGRRDARVRTIHNAENLNYGRSLQRGFAAARYDWVTHNGADLPLAPEAYEPFVRAFEKADVVVASSVAREAHSTWRKVTSWTNRALLAALFAPRTRDLNFTQFYRRSAIHPERLYSTSPAFVTPELIIRAERSGQRIIELEADFSRRRLGRAHFGRPKDIAWTLRDMLGLRPSTWLRGWDA